MKGNAQRERGEGDQGGYSPHEDLRFRFGLLEGCAWWEGRERRDLGWGAGAGSTHGEGHLRGRTRPTEVGEFPTVLSKPPALFIYCPDTYIFLDRNNEGGNIACTCTGDDALASRMKEAPGADSPFAYPAFHSYPPFYTYVL